MTGDLVTLFTLGILIPAECGPEFQGLVEMILKQRQSVLCKLPDINLLTIVSFLLVQSNCAAMGADDLVHIRAFESVLVCVGQFSESI